MEWYYVMNGERAGPVSQEQFDQLVQAGTILGGTLVWRAGMAAWLPWAQVSGATSPDGDTAVCAVSGRVYPKREMLEYEGKWVSNEHKDVFFQRIREGLPVGGMGGEGEVRYAGFWIRFLAAFIDGLCALALLIVPISIFTMLSAAVMGGMNRTPNSSNIGAYVLIQLAQMVVQYGIMIAYDVFFIRKYDATPGKMACGLKVLRANGDKLAIGRIIGRFFSKNFINQLTLCIGYMMAGWTDEKRGLHDMICDTRVIYKK